MATVAELEREVDALQGDIKDVRRDISDVKTGLDDVRSGLVDIKNGIMGEIQQQRAEMRARDAWWRDTMRMAVEQTCQVARDIIAFAKSFVTPISAPIFAVVLVILAVVRATGMIDIEYGDLRIHRSDSADNTATWRRDDDAAAEPDSDPSTGAGGSSLVAPMLTP